MNSGDQAKLEDGGGEAPVVRPEGHPAHLPWPPRVREYPLDHPARMDVESKQAFNEDWAREDFGDEFVDELKWVYDLMDRKFAGDWWLFACLRRCMQMARVADAAGISEHRMAAWNRVRAYLWLRGVSAHLEHACLGKDHLEHAYLSNVHLEYANLSETRLEYAKLHQVHLEHARLHRAHIEHTNLGEAHLEHANLDEAVLTGTDLRGITGLRFNANRVRDIHIEGSAPDPWSVLRREYTGPWFFVHATMLIAFVLPYVGQVIALSAAGQVWSRIESASPQLSDVVVTTTPAWKILIGLDRGWWAPALGAVLLLYNLIRGVLSLQVGMLRDAEERSGITPRLEEYMGTQGLEDEKFPHFIRPLLVHSWRVLISRVHRPKDKEGNRAAKLPFASIGFWRLHRMLNVLLWVSLASFAVHSWVWLTQTELPVKFERVAGDASGADNSPPAQPPSP